MSWLSAHPDLPAALDQLRSGGFRLVALTNSVLWVARPQLTHAGLTEQFEAVFSADEMRSLKSSCESYRMVADRCGVPVGAVCLIAAHSWDVSGALAAGCQAAVCSRSAQIPSPIGPWPQVVGHDLTEVAAGLLALPAGTHLLPIPATYRHRLSATHRLPKVESHTMTRQTESESVDDICRAISGPGRVHVVDR